MFGHFRISVAMLCMVWLVGTTASGALAAHTLEWEYIIGFVGQGVAFDVSASATDGYDGIGYDVRGPVPDSGQAGLRIYHLAGPNWTGSTGFYGLDTRSPIDPWVGYKTWDDIYLWSQDTAPGGNSIRVSCYTGYPEMPSWYHPFLYLDYVPQEAAWTGPMVFELDPHESRYLDLPIVGVSNPLDGVRMHFTVVTPEPSSMLALGLPALGMAGMLLRRRRR